MTNKHQQEIQEFMESLAIHTANIMVNEHILLSRIEYQELLEDYKKILGFSIQTLLDKILISFPGYSCAIKGKGKHKGKVRETDITYLSKFSIRFPICEEHREQLKILREKEIKK